MARPTKIERALKAVDARITTLPIGDDLNIGLNAKAIIAKFLERLRLEAAEVPIRILAQSLNHVAKALTEYTRVVQLEQGKPTEIVKVDMDAIFSDLKPEQRLELKQWISAAKATQTETLH